MAKPTRVILAERREFVRSCLTCWLDKCCGHYQAVAVADIDSTPMGDALCEAVVALIGVVDLADTDGWVGRQIECLRTSCPNLPIVFVADLESSEAMRAMEVLVRRSGVHGYLPTSTNIVVAGAALDLVVAGGLYFPVVREQAQLSPVRAPPDEVGPTVRHASAAKLTPREEAVLSVLAVGAQNKIIAYRLDMSMSTVKAHVHSIISKLNVRNRTEAVVAARALGVHASEARPVPTGLSLASAT